MYHNLLFCHWTRCWSFYYNQYCEEPHYRNTSCTFIPSTSQKFFSGILSKNISPFKAFDKYCSPVLKHSWLKLSQAVISKCSCLISMKMCIIPLNLCPQENSIILYHAYCIMQYQGTQLIQGLIHAKHTFYHSTTSPALYCLFNQNITDNTCICQLFWLILPSMSDLMSPSLCCFMCRLGIVIVYLPHSYVRIGQCTWYQAYSRH